MSKFTDEQKQAIETADRNLIVVAGAGSGKTRVLVERYLCMLEIHDDWPLNALVAITFTREAALEMRDRVRQSLEDRVRSSQDKEQSRWARLLGQMDSARIDTIHALCASILRANAAAARVDPGFEILEPVEADALLADVIDGEIRALAEENDPDGLVQLFMEYELRDIKAVLANPNLLHAPLDPMPQSAEDLLDLWQQQWADGYRQSVRQIDAQFGWYLTESIPDDDKIADVIRRVDSHWQTFRTADALTSFGAALDIDNAINLSGGSVKKWPDKESLDEAKDWLRQVRTSFRELIKTFGVPPRESPIDQTAADLLLRWYRLLHRVQVAYREAKADDAYLDFNDLESRTAQLLVEHPAVRERYRNREFKHLLVDEFQDTNADQWQIITALADMDDDAAFFLVGDPKQSIYGFRGADVSVFNRVQNQIAALPNGQRLGLTRSFRSHPGLINPFNHLFQQIFERDDASPVAAYQVELDAPMTAHRQAHPDPKAKIYAPLEFLLVGHNHYADDSESLKSDDRRQWEAYEIGQRLIKLVTDKAQIHDKEHDELRDFQYGDAALLFQSTTSITLYEAVFKALDIPFVTVAGRGYYDRQEVWDVLNALRALHNPSDNLSLAVALRSPMFAFSDDLLLALRRVMREDKPNRPVPLWDALTQTPLDLITEDDLHRVERTRDILYGLRGIAGRVTISELLRQLLARTGYLATLTGLPDGARLRRNVEKLVEMAESSGKSTLGAFSHYLGDLTAKEVREGEAALDSSGAVRLMTVHASKGLEFPVVVLVDAGWERRGGGGDVLVYDALQSALTCKVYNVDEGKYEKPFTYRHADELQALREEAERKRLLYVAATRARDMLLISGELRYYKSGKWAVKGWLKWLLDALYITEDSILPEDGQQQQIAATTVRFHLPDYDPALQQVLASGGEVARWRQLQITQDVPPPPLTQSVTVVQEAMLDHIAATQLANLGGLYHATEDQEIEYYQKQLRRQVFDDASGVIQEAARWQEPRIRRRQIGEVVHEALRYWRFPDGHDNIDAILRSYAWQQHITDPQQVNEVVERARRLLVQFQRSELYAEMQAVRERGGRWYSEVPFIYRTEKRIIHGVIDVLYEREAGDWRLIDYKTGIVRGGLDQLENHARRYHLQLGAYAAAAHQELGDVQIDAAIHYIHYTHTVSVSASIWQREIQQLETYIGKLIGDHHAQTSSR